MRILGRAKGKVAAQIRVEQLLVLVLADGSPDGLVNGQLIGLLLLRWSVLLLLGSKDLSLTTVLGFGQRTTEVSVVDVFWDDNLVQLDAGLGGNHITLGNPTEWSAVQGEGTGDEEQTRLENLQDNNSLSLVLTSQQDDNSTRNDRLPGVSLVGAEGSLGGTISHTVLGEQNLRLGLKTNGTLSTVLGSSDLLNGNDWLLGNGDLRLEGCLLTPQSLSLVLLVTRVTHNATTQIVVDRLAEFGGLGRLGGGLCTFHNWSHWNTCIVTVHKVKMAELRFERKRSDRRPFCQPVEY